MKRLLGLISAGIMVLGVFSAPVAADDTVKVWTQNLYLGADLTPVIEAAIKAKEENNPELFSVAAEAALKQMGTNLFPLRAQRLATEIALYEPDLIALQEVENIKVNDTNAGPPFVDYLQTLLNALALRGQHYDVAAKVVNLDLIVPLTLDLNGDGVYDMVEVEVVDQDVILVRNNVAFNKIAFSCDNYQSEDGCNYSTLATLPSPLPVPAPQTIDIKRGFVGVDATVRGKRVFFVTTHLEQRELRSGHPEDAGIQSAQAGELMGKLPAPLPGVPLILAGDFNSSSEDMGFDGIKPPYKIITDGIDGIPGFTDSWKRNPLALLDPKGLTCCQNEYLDNKTSLLYERIDIVFIRGGKFLPWEFVTTRVPLITPAPHWASDHGGVFAKLIFR